MARARMAQPGSKRSIALGLQTEGMVWFHIDLEQIPGSVTQTCLLTAFPDSCGPWTSGWGVGAQVSGAPRGQGATWKA